MEALKRSELVEMCKGMEIKGYSKYRKDELIQIITMAKKILTVAEVPVAPVETVTVAPVAEVPVAPVETVTVAPVAEVPVAPVETVTVAPVAEVPVAPEATVTKVSAVDMVINSISKNTDSRIILLRIKEVIQWLFGDMSFLPAITKKNKTADTISRKVQEDVWGQATLRRRRPDLVLDKQWTNKFGEHLCEEIYILLGKTVSKPVKKEHFQPDCEVDDAIIEAKAGTYFTTGTAHEKILGTPFKYADIPRLYSKPLKILCMGQAERVSREDYGNLPGAKCSPEKARFLQFFKENGIEYVAATDLLMSCCCVSSL